MSEALEAVTILNQEIYDRFDPECSGKFDSDMLRAAQLTFIADGYMETIEFLGQNLWDDQDNDVPWNEERTMRERPLIDHLRQRIRDTITELASKLSTI